MKLVRFTTSVNIQKPMMFFITTLFMFLLISIGSVSGAVITITNNRNWTDQTINPADDVIVRAGATLTVNVGNAACNSLQLGGTTGNGAGTLTFSGTNRILTVTGLVQIGGWGNANRDGTITFISTSTLTASSVIFGGTGGTPAQGTITMTNGGTLNTGSLTVGAGGGGTWTPGTGTVSLTATNTLPATIFTTFNNLTCSAGSTTIGVGLSINGILNIGNGATLSTSGSNFNITVGGNWTNNGTFTPGTGTVDFNGAGAGNIGASNFNNVTFSGAGTKTATGALTVAGNVSISNNFSAGAFTHTVGGNWTRSGGTFTPGTGTITLTGISSQLGGSVSPQNFYNLTVGNGNTTIATVTTVSNILTVNNGTNLIISGANSLTPVSASIDGTVTVSGTGSLVKGTGVIQFNSGSTYNHNRDGGAIPISTWNVNSTCLVSGVAATVPTLATFNQTFGNFTWNCTTQSANISLAGNLTDINGNFSVLSTNTSSLRLVNAAGSIALNVDGNYSQIGGTLFVYGDVVSTGFTSLINILGNFSISNGTLNLTGNACTGTVNIGGNYTMTGGTITESDTGIANINFNGSTTQIYSKTAGTFSNTVNFGIGSTSTVDFGTSLLDGSGGTFNLLGSGTIITKNTGGFALSGATGTVQVTGTRNYSSTANYIFNGTSAQVTGTGVVTANNITLDNLAGISLSTSTTVNNILTLTNGVLSLGANNLTMGASALAIANGGVGADFDATRMIVATGSGQVRRLLTTNGSYFFPIGDATATSEYSPVTVTLTSGTYAGGAYISANVTNAKHPNNTSTINYINRYWTIGSSGITTFVGNINAKYVNADLVGSSTYQITARYAASAWTIYNLFSNNALIANNLTAFGDFSSIEHIPAISAAPNSITTFTYQLTGGPSNILNFTVTGTKLVENVLVYPSSSFEISDLGGTNFLAQPFTTLLASGGTVNQVVYVRMKSGLSLGAIGAENLTISTTGAPASIYVACSGTVTAQPSITLATSPSTNPVSLSGFTATFKGAASAQQSFTITAANLNSNVTVSPPANYEISITSGSGFVSTALSIAPTSGSLIAKTGALTNYPIYVRLKSGLGVGNYNENLVASSTFADNKTVILSGTVNPIATITTNTSWLAGFIYSGTGPSTIQTFQLIGKNLSANIAVTPPANFELSTDGTTWNTSVFNVTQTGGNVNQQIYARLRTGRTANTAYGPENVTLASTGAVIKTVALNGFVANAATILVSKNSLNGFGYLFGNGPSVEQEFTVSGAVLTNNITITPSANFEISTSVSPRNFTTGAITLTLNGDTVGARKIFVRLVSGLSANSYNGNITVSSSGASNKTISLTAKVFATPLITSSGGGNYCIGETINLTSSGSDVTSRFWTGPNNYYSNQNNNSLTNATVPLSGNYTVKGNLIVGGNLIINGDFEMDNAAFSSSYGYVAPVAGALYPEGLYTVTNLASNVHGNFNSTPDKNVIGTKQMIINGNITAGAVVWTQSVPVIPNAEYEFSYWLQTVVNGTDVAPSKLQLYVNGIMAGPIYVANPTSGIWTQYIYNTLSESNNILNLELINQTTAANGNDFALDSISFKQVLSATSTENVVVNASLVASVTVTHSPTNVYQNSPVVFTANPVNGGATPTYKWFVGGVEQIGQTASTLSYTPTSTGSLAITCEMTSSIACAAPKPASGPDNITVGLQPVNYWYGYTDTDWGKPENWTENFVPATGDNVIYATVANFGSAAIRNLQLDKNRTIGSLINATIRSLIIPANLTLICNNVITVTPPVTDPVTKKEDLILIHASSTLPNGSIIYRNPQNTPAFGTVEMYSPASWDKTKPVNQKFNWQFFGIPITSVYAMPTFEGAYVRELFEYDNDTATHWRMISYDSAMIPFKGYELCQQYPAFYTFKGQLINSNYNSGQFVKTTTGNALYPGQHLFANPYTSAIDIRQIEFGTGVEATAYLYNTGTFTSWKNNPIKSGTLENPLPGQYNSAPKEQAGSIPGIPRQVPSMGTFMVRVPKANATTAQSYINLSYNTVAMGNLDRQRVKAQSYTDEQAITEIIVEGEYGLDRMWMMSHEKYNRNFDNGYDGLKLLGFARNPQLYAVEKDGNYQINSVDDLNNTTLAFQAGQDIDYKMVFKHNEKTFQKYNKIFLHDLVDNRIVDISLSGSEYSFTASSSPNAVVRFKLLAQNIGNSLNRKDIYSEVYCFDNQIYIQNFSELGGEVYIYNLSGSVIGIKTIGANENIQIAAPKNNIYIVKTVIGESTETVKLFIK